MIRINLLPRGKRQTAVAPNVQAWGLAYLGAALVALAAVTAWHFSSSGVLDEQLAANRALQDDIDRAERRSADLHVLEEKLAKSRQLESVVAQLQGARTGPARVLMELSRVLSEHGGPTIDEAKLHALRKANPLAGYNPGWDVRRLWLETFEESDQRCTIRGRGKSNEDVAEFLRRLSLSEVFSEVALERTSSITEGASKVSLIEFTLNCAVRY